MKRIGGLLSVSVPRVAGTFVDMRMTWPAGDSREEKTR